MFQLYLLRGGVWHEHGEPFGQSRKLAVAQVRDIYTLGTWKLRKVK